MNQVWRFEVGRMGYRRPAQDRGVGGNRKFDVYLKELGSRGVVSVLLEGGPTLAGSFVAEGLVDRVVGYVAPALLGAGPSVLAEAGVATIEGAVRLRLDDVTTLGDDVRLTLRPRPTEA
jgi:diaminohydroxyphosphoribosylaminopyrimidine deaminase/5-amino-6-(5-phosphoribosylamino)uracil reductase